VRNRDPPEGFAYRELARDFLAFAVRYTVGGKGCRCCGGIRSVEIQLGHSVDVPDDLRDNPALARHPRALDAIVQAGRDRRSRHEVQKVIDINRHGLVERDAGRPGGERLISAQLDGIRVMARRR
jgi:hypothetical protein